MGRSAAARRKRNCDRKVQVLSVIHKLGVSRWLAIGLILICFVREARALDPNRTLLRYLREKWTTDGAFPGGAIGGIQETTDGYGWERKRVWYVSTGSTFVLPPGFPIFRTISSRV